MKKKIPINEKAMINFNLVKGKTINLWYDCYTIKYSIFCDREIITKGDINIISLKDIIFGKRDLCIQFIHSTSYKELAKINYKTDIFKAIKEYRRYIIKMFIGN